MKTWTLIKQYIFILIGFILIIFTLWNRFFRLRLPKDIPIHLQEFSLISYSIITITFIILFVSLISKIYTRKEHEKNMLFKFFIDVYYNSLVSLHEFLLTKVDQDKYTVYQTKIMNFVYRKRKMLTFFFFLLNVLPKVTLVLVFLFDVIYMKQLFYFYKILPCIIIPLSCSYLIYTFRQTFNTRANSLDERLSIHILDPKGPLVAEELTVHAYCKEMVVRRLNIITTEINCIINISIPYIQKVILKHNINVNTHKLDHGKVLLIYQGILKNLLNEYTVLYSYDLLKNKYDIWINFFMYFCYSLGWSYILFVSFHSLPIDSFSYIPIFFDTIEPFSGIQL